jgi:hypothetical protein
VLVGEALSDEPEVLLGLLKLLLLQEVVPQDHHYEGGLLKCRLLQHTSEVGPIVA